MTLKTSSQCFVPSFKPSAVPVKADTAIKQDSESDSSGTPTKEKNHAGRSKWGKYKKQERAAKKFKGGK